ncbi:hypothetical protein ACWIGM_08840 [Bosea sp. NPDC055332]
MVFLSACYANEDHSSVVAQTDDFGAVLISQDDRPVLWSEFEASGIVPTEFVPSPPPIVPITDRQFAHELAVRGTITEEEALDWAARGDLPAVMESAIGTLPTEARFAARMLLRGAVTYDRQHPIVDQIGAIFGYNQAEIDDLWRAAAAR